MQCKLTSALIQDEYRHRKRFRSELQKGCLHSPAWKSMPTAREVPDTGTRASDLSAGSRGIPRMPSCTEYSKNEPIPTHKHTKTAFTPPGTQCKTPLTTWNKPESRVFLNWNMFVLPRILIKSKILVFCFFEKSAYPHKRKRRKRDVLAVSDYKMKWLWLMSTVLHNL